MSTPILGLPELATGQIDAYIQHNEALRKAEAFIAGVITSRTLTAPPTTPVEGSLYIPAAPATGAWASKENKLQHWLNNGWRTYESIPGTVWFVIEEEKLYFFDGALYIATGGDGGVELDSVNVFTKTQTVEPVGLTDGSTIAVDGSLSNTFTITLGGNRTLGNPTNLQAGAVYNFHVSQDATGGRTLSYGTAYKFGADGAPTLSTLANEVDWLSFQTIGSDLRFAGIKNGF
ncbi:MAG: DUF2793 domain-containing protein [Acaryochloridaceae cyanobacterium SU_2_1]|nr:DUF2793 domain-containing protein [Acaryochloridaceae cyanobacterium SU_2_1]